ncbi:RNA methyltransferase [Bacillus carboniphilus]|uniref:RNA methyltransferase n=1 Tax=Bacillus carboniphilus TaxID=86663 RepID=A0ABY9JXN8_9BACI|nr:RNA methyltransferase [Bacillus carboniphilus]WLR44141.1 RNA methyltransferase [Bacillus carboniphilus]
MIKIESAQNDRVKKWRKLHERKYREKQQLFLIEGFHLIEEALKYKGIVEEIIKTEGVEIPNHWKTADIISTTTQVMKSLSETETSQEVVAVCHMSTTLIDFTKKRFLLVDGVQDPGNLGTMIRTADAAGFDAVIIGKGTVDLYNSKVIRSTQGSIFHLPIVKEDLSQAIEHLKNHQIKVIGTALENSESYNKLEKPSRFAIIVGNEGKGMNKQLLTQTDVNVSLPIYGQAESLNVAVAAGILMYYYR